MSWAKGVAAANHSWKRIWFRRNCHVCSVWIRFSLRGEWDARGEHTDSGALTQNANHVTQRWAVSTVLARWCQDQTPSTNVWTAQRSRTSWADSEHFTWSVEIQDKRSRQTAARNDQEYCGWPVLFEEGVDIVLYLRRLSLSFAPKCELWIHDRFIDISLNSGSFEKNINFFLKFPPSLWQWIFNPRG